MQATSERSRKIQPFDSDRLTPFCAKGYKSLSFAAVSLDSWVPSLCLPRISPQCCSGPAQSGSPGLTEGRSGRVLCGIAVCGDRWPGLALPPSSQAKGLCWALLICLGPVCLLSMDFISFFHFGTSSGHFLPSLYHSHYSCLLHRNLLGLRL